RALILFTVHLPAVVRRPSTSYSRHVRRFKWHGAGEADRNSPDGKRLDGPGDRAEWRKYGACVQAAAHSAPGHVAGQGIQVWIRRRPYGSGARRTREKPG